MGYPKKGKKKGALFFTVDTMVAGIVFTMTVLVVLSIYLTEPETQDTYLVVDNYATYLTNVKMESFRNVYRYVYDDPNEENPDFSVHQKISKLVMDGNEDLAQGFVENFTNILVPPQFGVSYSIDKTVIFTRATGQEEFATTNLSVKLLTYYTENEILYGPNITTVSIWS